VGGVRGDWYDGDRGRYLFASAQREGSRSTMRISLRPIRRRRVRTSREDGPPCGQRQIVMTFRCLPRRRGTRCLHLGGKRSPSYREAAGSSVPRRPQRTSLSQRPSPDRSVSARSFSGTRSERAHRSGADSSQPGLRSCHTRPMIRQRWFILPALFGALGSTGCSSGDEARCVQGINPAEVCITGFNGDLKIENQGLDVGA
jgi:hypothetical protein